jgi:hypothetical protein
MTEAEVKALNPVDVASLAVQIAQIGATGTIDPDTKLEQALDLIESARTHITQRVRDKRPVPT